MIKIALPALAAAAFALLLVGPSVAANASAAKTNNSAVKTAAERSAWAPQTLSGTLTIVDPAKKLVVIQTADGIPYDLDVTHQTRIMNGAQSVSLQNLNQDVNQNVSVKLIPERRGDVVTSIRIGN